MGVHVLLAPLTGMECVRDSSIVRAACVLSRRPGCLRCSGPPRPPALLSASGDTSVFARPRKTPLAES